MKQGKIVAVLPAVPGYRVRARGVNGTNPIIGWIVREEDSGCVATPLVVPNCGGTELEARAKEFTEEGRLEEPRAR